MENKANKPETEDDKGSGVLQQERVPGGSVQSRWGGGKKMFQVSETLGTRS